MLSWFKISRKADLFVVRVDRWYVSGSYLSSLRINEAMLFSFPNAQREMATRSNAVIEPVVQTFFGVRPAP